MDSIGGGVRGGGVGWGGVVWADNVHVRLRNYVMLRWCNVLARLHIYAVLRWCNVLARLHIYAVLRWCNVHVRLHIYAVLRWCNVLARLHIYTCEMKQMLLKLFVVWCRNWSLKKWHNVRRFCTWMSKIHGCVNPCYHVFGQNWLYIDGSNHEILAIFLEYV